MTARLFIPLIPLALVAAIAAAQDANAPPAVDRPEATVPAIDFPWDAITAQWTERRYKVEAISFKARDESGIDWPGSDEIMVGTVDAEGSTATNEIGDIDSGDTHEFDLTVSCIIGVLPGIATLGDDSVCDAAGKPGPFSFQVEFWEKDSSIFGGFCAVVGPLPGRHVAPHCVDDRRGDDFIGWRELFFPVPDLESTLPNVGDSFTETVVLSPCPPGSDVCGDWDFPDYSFTYRTTRLPDVGTDFRSQLLAAMERSQIAGAGDAVAAGLRLLASPGDRKAEPNEMDDVAARR